LCKKLDVHVEFLASFFSLPLGVDESERERRKKNEISMPSSPRHPSSPMRRGGGGTSPLSSAREQSGSASKNPRRNHASSQPTSTTTSSSTNPLLALASQSPPALALRTFLGFALGSLGVLAFLWFSSRATTGEGIPSTLLLARQRTEREVREDGTMIVAAKQRKEKEKKQLAKTSTSLFSL